MTNIYNKLFAGFYLILIYPFYFAADSKFSLFYLLLCIPALIFSLLHWKISNNLKNLLREDLFALFSLISFFVVIYILYITYSGGTSEGEGYYVAFVLLPILAVSSLLSVTFGISSIFTNRSSNIAH